MNFSHRLCALLFSVSFSVFAADKAPENAEAKTRRWNQKMQELASTFSTMLPILVDPKPPTPAQLTKLRTGARKMSKLAHGIKMTSDTLPPEADPSLGIISDLFERELKRAAASIEGGYVQFGKSELRAVAGYCIACHTRHEGGPRFPTAPVEGQLKNLSGMEKGELLTALRQFDGAYAEFEKIAVDPQAVTKRQLEWGRALRHALAISVRVKRDPDQALALVDRVMALSTLPEFSRQTITAWRESLLEWKKEGGKRSTDEDGLFQEATRLSEAAQKIQAYPLDHRADILYLRTTVAAHELLSQHPTGKKAAEALWLAGNAYTLLDNGPILPMPRMYFEACVRKAPHTPVAHKCFVRFEEDLHFGYTGSGGTFIPADLEKLTQELKKLASPKAG